MICVVDQKLLLRVSKSLPVYALNRGNEYHTIGGKECHSVGGKECLLTGAKECHFIGGKEYIGKGNWSYC